MRITVKYDTVQFVLVGLIITIITKTKTTKLLVQKDHRQYARQNRHRQPYLGKAAVYSTNKVMLAGNFNSPGEAVKWVRDYARNNEEIFS